jgi:hypothetical protein
VITKRYLKSRQMWKVTFELPKAELPEGIEVTTIHVVGDFNDWDTAATPMKQSKKGTYRATLELEPAHDYLFRYLINGEHWYNDWHADGYMPTGFGEDNCVVALPAASG